MLERVVGRIKQSQRIDRIVIATTTDAADDPVAAWCGTRGVDVFRGHPTDVLDRYYQAAKAARADIIVRLTADCPLQDAKVIDEIIARFLETEPDFASNLTPPTYPDGVEAEVFSFEALCCAHRLAKRPSEREHVTPFIIRNPDLFRLENLAMEEDLSSGRWTVDEAADLELVRKVYEYFGSRDFGWRDVHALLESKPEWRMLNQDIVRNEGYAKSLAGEIGKGQALYEKAKRIIPGGTQLLSKRPEMFLPDQWPAYYAKARGCEVWDLDGRRYLDFTVNGIGASLLGFADDDVNDAVISAITKGTNATLNCPEEVELAELLCEIHPWAEMARFTRCGGESMAAAVRIARAATGRDKVAFCGYHGWQDWYLAANLAKDSALDGHLLPGLQPQGVPRGLCETALPFRYNHPEELEAIVREHGDNLAAIIVEPVRSEAPQESFFPTVQKLARESGAVLIVDEITMGFRLTGGGAHVLYGLQPDVAVFAKGMSNGFAMAAIIGRRSIMEAAQTSFISSTYWTERIGPTAALATIKKLRRLGVAEQLAKTGRAIKAGWRTAAEHAGLEITIGGLDALPSFAVKCDKPLAAKTLITQEMLKRGFLAATAVYVTHAHQKTHVEEYLAACADVFGILATAVKTQSIESLLEGPVAHSGFQRLT